jgi:hypothetical protein
VEVVGREIGWLVVGVKFYPQTQTQRTYLLLEFQSHKLFKLKIGYLKSIEA